MSLQVPSGVVLIWLGTHAGIPAQWSRETTLDSRFVKGWGDEVPNSIGGSNTHTHSGGSHSHTINSHTHTFIVDSVADQSQADAGTGLAQAHSHTGTITSATSGGTLQSQSVTWSSVNNEPPYYQVVFIKPTSGWARIDDEAIASFYNGASVPTNWEYCDGGGSTPDLRNTYIKGAATGQDSGSGSGATSHQHTITHSHTSSNHSHTGSSGARTGGGESKTGGTGDDTRTSHTHTVSLANTNAGANEYTNTTAGSGDTVEPAYKKMGIIRNNGDGRLEKGLIGMWLGAVADVPVGWFLCDGDNNTIDLQNKYLKCGTSLAQNEDIGGSNTHQHSSVSHTHTATGTHTHVGSTSGADSCAGRQAAVGNGNVGCGHTHGISSESSQTAVWANSSVTCDVISNEPAYRTAAFIEYQFTAGAAAFFSSILC